MVASFNDFMDFSQQGRQRAEGIHQFLVSSIVHTHIDDDYLCTISSFLYLEAKHESQSRENTPFPVP